MRLLLSSPSAGPLVAVNGAVYRPVNEPQPVGEAAEGSEALLWELARVRSAGEGKGRERRMEVRALSCFLGSQHLILILYLTIISVGCTTPHTL